LSFHSRRHSYYRHLGYQHTSTPRTATSSYVGDVQDYKLPAAHMQVFEEEMFSASGSFTSATRRLPVPIN
jgi:hypothetical protein